MKTITALLIAFGVLVPAFASASSTITSVTLNGGSSVMVDPGGNIVAAVTAQLTDKTKWKGTGWGINTTSETPTCVNTKNAKEGTRKNDTGSFTEVAILKAPQEPGLYHAYFRTNESNNCDKPNSALFTLQYAVRVGTNTAPPVISGHDDVPYPLAAGETSASVTYTLPTAADYFGNPVPVSCSPAPGATFSAPDTLVQCTAADSWGNTAIPLYFHVLLLPPPDATAPVIAPHADVSVSTANPSGTEISYVLPTAIDETDGEVPVSCTPAPGSTFALGTTTVNCSAHDAAGNVAASAFAVVVNQEIPSPPSEPVIYIMKQQSDESYLCGETTGSWQVCDQSATFGFTQDFGPTATINLGAGAQMGEGAPHSLTIANTPQDSDHPWLITLECYRDENYTQSCADWNSVSQSATESSDSVHWTAEFDDITTLAPDSYYRLIIDHTVNGVEWPAPAYGSLSLMQPYFVLKGILE
ncbi:MAG TPA: HYR domain-containing protein [Candidatus Paceibacterota bacterium]